MARLVQAPRKRRPSASSSSSSNTDASPRIMVVRRPGQSTSQASMAASTRSVSTSTIGKAKLVDIPAPLNIKPRRSARRSTASADVLVGEDTVIERPQSRNISGETLVDSQDLGVEKETEPEHGLLEKGIQALDMDWSVEELAHPAEEQQEPKKAQKSGGKRATRFSTLANAVASSASTLGKRSREVFESGREKLLGIQQPNKRASLRSRADMSAIAEESKAPLLGSAEEEPPKKRSRISVQSAPNLLTITETTVVKKSPPKSKKRWLASGLYTGQQRWFNPKLNGTRNQKFLATRLSTGAPPVERQVLPLPMFVGERLLDVGREFRVPFDVFSPLPPGQPRPEDWKKTSWNRFVGVAATDWRFKMPEGHYRCICNQETGCDEDCQNRYMFYECDDSNCNVGAEFCKNRSFADLKERYKRGNKYDVGVELIKTVDKGFGVRACRTFEPGQVIVEYAGEIITQEECERRMKEEYANNECYYLMEFDQNMIIDATRGSIARFVNHSCEPNCKMVKWTVAGKPRMALFAGDGGIMTGEELSYDYNFDPFSTKNVQVCRCGAPSCRGFLGPRTTQQKERQASEEKSQKPKAKPKKTSRASTGMLAGTKRKIQALMNDVTTTAAPQPAVVGNKRRRATTDGATALTVESPPKKRVVSSASTLVEKENVHPRTRGAAPSPSSPAHPRPSSSPAGVKARNIEPASSPAPSPARKQASTKTGGLVRRNTLNALSRAASSLKQSASTLKRKASTKTHTTAAASTAERAKRPSSATALETSSHGAKMNVKLKPAKSTASAKKSPKSVQTAGTVRSVKGQRRADAMKKMGLGSKRGRVSNGKVGKSVRVVEEEWR